MSEIETLAKGWRPIETAPRDGTAIFAVLTGSDLPHTVRYHKTKWLIAWDAYDLSADCDAPTHWIPIPAIERGDFGAREG